MSSISELQLNKFKPMALIVLSGVLYGFLGCLGTKIFAEKIPLSSMLFWRFLIAGLWMAAVSLWKNKTTVFTLSELRIHFASLALCALCYSLGSIFYFLASRTAGTGIAMVVFFSYPMFVAMHTFHNNNWRTDRYTFSALIAIPFGLILLSDRNNNTPNTVGIVFAILSAVAYAIYIIKSKLILKIIGPNQFTFIVCWASAIIFLIMTLIGGDFNFPTSMKSIGYLCAIGIFATAIPIQLLLEGLKEISALKASMASVLEPIVTLLIGFALLSESVTSLQIAGVIVILFASVFIQVARD